MEVAGTGQWRRHWAGTAEYGKVTEGGVTTRVARAVEVMQANAPGARVRVMRAAYHSTAGPGAPATSFLMHSSRRVISSGFNLLESPSFPTKALEISSVPLESSPDRNTEENYEVTEPDDLDISEPSKWRGSTAGSTRMPSEESSSADNASIIDLDSRHKHAFRKYSYDSENSDIPFPRRSSRVSPLLESPEDLSTLKYKSLLTGSNEWNNRRKSYSFEDTSPLNETVLHSNDTVAMESSTDSGICKSTELVNGDDDKYFEKRDGLYDKREETFKDWLSKNRGTSPFYKNSQRKPYREYDTVVEDPLESNIALKSAGKITITVPIKVADDYEYKKSNLSEDCDRRAKRVEFCKTELHFAADSGKVNIIATDEKPPPANDFRKRRSAFVPIRGKFEEKPITLFGDTSKDFLKGSSSDFSTSNSGTSEFDENTATTKSILKNKIPKPKPYLLGENMDFGENDVSNITKETRPKVESPVPTAVALINRQLESQRRYSNDNAASRSLATEIESPCVKKAAYRTTTKGPSVDDVSETNERDDKGNDKVAKPVTNKLKMIQMSPVLGRARTRQLRDSELSYFGVGSNGKHQAEAKPAKEYTSRIDNKYDDEFHSVRLIQKVNSACNSEAESEDAPEYQNLPLKINFGPIPVPRVRTKLEYQPQEQTTLNTVPEQDVVENYTSRRSRHRRLEDSSAASRSISEPPKPRYKIKENSPRSYNHHKQMELEKRSPTPRFAANEEIEVAVHKIDRTTGKRKESHTTRKTKEEPLYVNLGVQKNLLAPQTKTDSRHRSNQQRKRDAKTENKNNLQKSEIIITDIEPTHVLHQDTLEKKDHPIQPEKVRSLHNNVKEIDKESLRKKQPAVEKRHRSQRTEKLCTPEYSSDTLKQKVRDSSSVRRKLSYDLIEETAPVYKAEERRSKSSHRTPNAVSRGSEERKRETDVKISKRIPTNTETDKPSTTERTSQRNSLVDKTSERREMKNKSYQLDTNSYDSGRNASTHRSKDTEKTEKIPHVKPGNNKETKHSQYVINYDDKNGTVSSVCKVKPISGTEKKKLVANGVRDKLKDRKIRNKSPERKVRK